MGWRETAAATLADAQNISDDGKTQTDVCFPPSFRLVRWVERGLFAMPNSDRIALARELLEETGMVVASCPKTGTTSP